MVQAEIGVHRHEKRRSQPVRINIDLTVKESGQPLDDRLENVVDYETLVEGVRPDRRRPYQFGGNPRGADRGPAPFRQPGGSTRVRVEKIQVMKDAESVGVEIERRRRVTDT